MEPEPRLPGPVRLVALLSCEVGVVVALHQLGRHEWMRVDLSDLSRWLDETPPEDALVATVRLVALAVAWWMLASTAVYAAAGLARAPRAVRSVHWATLPPLRRLVDGIVALSITGTVVANSVPSPPAGATTHVAVDADRDVGLPARLPATAGMKMAVYRSTSPLPDPVSGSTTHTVEPGDSLWEIAERTLGDAKRWPEIWNANRDRLAAAGYEDPNVLLVGWVLDIPNPSVAPRPATHTVRPGETLAQIAADELGDPRHADQLFGLNVGRPQPGGDSLADPDLIRPGWSLILHSEPNGHTAPPGEPQPTEAGEPSDSDEPPVTAHDPPLTIDGPSAVDDPERGTAGTAPGSPERSAEPSTTVPETPTPPDAGTGPPTTLERETDDEDEDFPIPVLGAAGTLLAVATLRVVRRRWARRAATSAVASVPDAPPTSARVVLREMLEADESYSRGVDAALAHLAAALRPRSGEGCPQPRLVQVRPERIDVLLDRPDPSPPPPWRPEASGLTWVLDGAAVVDATYADATPLPALVTVGTGDGDLLIDLEAYGVVSLVGDESGCKDVARSMIAELSARSEGTVLIEVVGDTLDGTPVRLDGVSSVASWDEVDLRTIDASARMLDTGRWPHTFAARASGRIYDGWAPTIWITESSEDDRYDAALERVAARPGAGSAIVVVGADPGRGLRIEVDAEGGFAIPELSLSGEAQKLGADVADQLVELVEDADTIPDTAIDDELRDSPAQAPPGQMGYEDPPFDVLVRVCGPLRVEGGRHELPQRETAVAAFVALNGQADIDQIREAVWAGLPSRGSGSRTSSRPYGGQSATRSSGPTTTGSQPGPASSPTSNSSAGDSPTPGTSTTQSGRPRSSAVASPRSPAASAPTRSPESGAGAGSPWTIGSLTSSRSWRRSRPSSPEPA